MGKDLRLPHALPHCPVASFQDSHMHADLAGRPATSYAASAPFAFSASAWLVNDSMSLIDSIPLIRYRTSSLHAVIPANAGIHFDLLSGARDSGLGKCKVRNKIRSRSE